MKKIIDLNEDTDTDAGGIRGLTTIKNPNGKGSFPPLSLGSGRPFENQIKRLDPDGKGGYSVHDEAMIMELMKDKLGVEIPIPWEPTIWRIRSWIRNREKPSTSSAFKETSGESIT